jgi:hypothetical protein
MRLVGSSIPGAVERDAALHLLSERAVLTRMLCCELCEAKELPDRRVNTAYSMLLTWIAQNFPEDFPEPMRLSPRPSHGLNRTAVPDEGRHLLAEIVDGARVGEALYMWNIQDIRSEAARAEAALRERLENYWAHHGNAVRPPWFFDGKWPSIEGD